MLQRLKIREGWAVVLLTSAVVYIAVWSILQADWAEGLGILNLVTFAGLAAGFVAAKWRRVPALLVHLGAMLFGFLVILFQMTEYLNDRIGGRRDKLHWLWDRTERWVAHIRDGNTTEDLYLFVFFVCVISYLLAYSSMWFVLRTRWIWAALVFPGMLLFINLGYSLRVPNTYVVFYLFFSILLLVRFSIMQRESDWRRSRVEYPSSLPWRGMWVASYLAVLVLIFGWAVPANAQSERAHDAWLRVDGPWRSVERQFNQWFAGLRGTQPRGVGGFASFSDEFDLGGPLRLSDAPVVLVTGADQAPYLAAYRYAVYTGEGWESDVTDPNDETATSDVPPQVSLEPSDRVPTDAVNDAERGAQRYDVQVRRPRGSLLFIPEVFARASIGTNIVVPWETVVDEDIDVQSATEDGVRAELWPLVRLLQTTDFTPLEPAPTATPDPAETPDAVTLTPTPTATLPANVTPTPVPPAPEPPEVRDEIARLTAQGITASYQIDPETYQVTTVIYSGEFPLYSDVEAVYARDGLGAGEEYEVESLESGATSDQLRQAGTAGLDEMTRYLQLPDTVTQRTIVLAAEITGGANNNFDKSMALVNWLRTNVTYSEDIDFPPDDQDRVDYLLFDSREGYCEYYASAFAVMARSLGIPTRMVVGFFPADFNDDEDGFLYRELNAHAWPEVYFPGYGWIAFEPTANRPVVTHDPAPAGTADPRATRPAGTTDGSAIPPEDEFLTGPLRESAFTGAAAGSNRSSNDEVSRLEWGIRLAVLALLAAAVGTVFFWLRGLRGLTPGSQMFTRFSRGASWGGLKQNPALTPHEYAQSVAREVPGSRQSAMYLTDLYVKETYGGATLTQSEMLRARQAWVRLRALFVKHFFSRLKPWKSSRPADADADW